MTADAGELKSRVSGSKDDVENFGDLKCGNELKNNNACSEGEEIGGSFVIVNGDSDDGTDRDLGKSDADNGNLNLKNETSHENGKKLEEKSEDWNLVHGRSNGDCIENEKEKEGGVIKVEEYRGVVEVDNGKVEEGNKVILHEEEEEVLDVAKEKQDGQTLIESDPKVELEPEVEVPEVGVPISVILESDSVVEPETLISEQHDSGDSVVAVETEVKQDLTVAEEETAELQKVEERSDLVNAAQKIHEVETEIKQNLIVSVEDTQNLAEVKDDVELESKQDLLSEKEVNESADLEKLVKENGCELEEVSAFEQQQDIVFNEEQNIIDVEAETKSDSGSTESGVLVNEIDNHVEQMSNVEAEPEMDNDIVFEETRNVEAKLKHENDSVGEEANNIDVESEHNTDPADENTENDEVKSSLELHSIDEDTQNVAVDLSHESHPIVGETKNSELVFEHKSDSDVEVIKNVVVEEDHESDPIVKEVKHVEVELEQGSDPVVEEVKNVEVELEQESDPVFEETKNVEVEFKYESDPIVEEVQHVEIEMEQESIPKAEEAKKVEVSDPVVVGTKNAVIKLKNASDPIVQKVEKSELDASAREYVPLNLVLVNTGNERVGTHVKDVVNHGNTMEPRSEVESDSLATKLCSKSKSLTPASEKEQARNEMNTGLVVDAIRVESESGAEGSKCMFTSIEDEKQTNKYHKEEKSKKQAQSAETVQVPLETHVARKQYIYMIKVPKVVDVELGTKVQHAYSIVDGKTKLRDSIGEETREHAAVVNNYSLDYKAELAKEKAARAVFNAKRKEIDNIQVQLSRLNNANSIADIDEKIRTMVHKQQHETITLKQEKQYIHDITQMKRLKEQLSSKNPTTEQFVEAINQKDEIESQHKNLKKELDSLRVSLSERENSVKSAWNKYMEQEQILKTLREKYNAADADRQEAYLSYRKLRSQQIEKNKLHKMYRDDQQAAGNYMFLRDIQGLRSHCSKQVEKVMEIWNKSPEFREQYVTDNSYSTLRRLGTADGRQLGPGEKAPTNVRPRFYNNTNNVSQPSSSTQPSAPVLKSEVTKEQSIEPSKSKQEPKSIEPSKSKQEPKSIEPSKSKQEPKSIEPSKSKQEPKSKQTAKSKPRVSTSEEANEKEKVERENKLKKEEEEKAKREEEMMREKAAKEEERMSVKAAEEEKLRKEREAVELKEKLRLEQKLKAKEAEERKRRQAEKAKARAEIKAQKEAELREKKKAKKENKKSGISDTGSEAGEEGSAATETKQHESSQDPDSSSSSATTTKKRTTKTSTKTKQYNKVQPLPLPLRNKNRRKMITTWIYAVLIALSLLALFFAGNYISFSSSNILPNFDI